MKLKYFVTLGSHDPVWKCEEITKIKDHTTCKFYTVFYIYSLLINPWSNH